MDCDALVTQALQGCEDSFAALARYYHPRLIRLITPRLAQARYADAEDVAQEALTRAFRSLHQFDRKYRFSTWLYTIALHVAWDHNRRTHRHPIHDPSICVDQIASTKWHWDAVAEKEQVQGIWDSAQRILDESSYTILWLRFGEDLSVSEIAHLLKKTQIGVRVALHRARCKLIRYLPKDGLASNTHAT